MEEMVIKLKNEIGNIFKKQQNDRINQYKHLNKLSIKGEILFTGS